MSNIKSLKTKTVKITLDKERKLVFDLNAYAELEIKYGSVAKAMEMLQEGSIRSIRSLLWAALIHDCYNEETEKYTLTERQVGAMIGIDDLDRVTEAITDAMTDTMAEDDEVTEAGTAVGNVIANPLS